MKSAISLLLVIFLAGTCCGFTNTPGSYLVSSKLVKSHTKKTLAALWKKHHVPRIAMPIKNDVDIYEVIYLAPWIDSSTWIKCSGLIFVPKVKNKKAPTFMYGHGTAIGKIGPDQEEYSDGSAENGIALFMAADGYFALYPDYYGIGRGEGQHLYTHAWSEGMAFLYMLYAAEEFKKSISFGTNGQIFLTGYSQGGHASFAAQKYIEAAHDPRFKVTAASPMSGAYDLTGEQSKYMYQPYPHPYYLPYLIVSYQTAYHVFPDRDIFSVFRAPYDTAVRGKFGDHPIAKYNDVDRFLPSIPSQVLRPEIVEQLKTDTNNSFIRRLKENSLTDWVPEAPVQLCYCQGDREVNYKNSQVAYDHMTRAGKKDIRLNNQSDHLDHNTCAAFAVLSMKAFFDRYKKHGKNPKLKALSPFKQTIANFVKRKIEKEYMKDARDHAYM